MVQVTKSIIIERPVEEVFGIVEDAESWPRWMPNILAARRITDGATREGSEFDLRINRWGRRTVVHDEVTEYEPGSKVGFYCREASTAYGFDTRSENGSARVTFDVSYELPGIMSAADPVVQKMMERYVDTVLENLRSYAGGRPPKPEAQLEEEWDLDRSLQAWAGSLTLASLVLGRWAGPGWRLLAAFVGANLLGRALYGWCPPVPVLRKLGVRSCEEIERQRYTGEIS